MQKDEQIPDDLIVNMLWSLPAKSLVRFKCVCKSWLSFINQLKYGNDELILCSSSCLHSINLDESEIKAVTLGYPLKSSCDFKVIGSCNGLLCFYNRIETFVLWNPWTRRYKTKIKTVSSNKSSHLYGFGYDHSTDDYIIVRIFYNESGKMVEIYSCKTDSWLQMGNLPEEIMMIWPWNKHIGVFVNGALYWHVPYAAENYKGHVRKYWYEHNYILDNILCFDLVDRKFSTIVPPDDEVCKKPVFDLCVLGGRLWMVNYGHDCHTVIWAWEGNKEGNWIKLMTIPCLKKYLYPVFLMNNGELLWKEINLKNHWRGKPFLGKNQLGKKLFVYNQKQKTFRELKIPYAQLSSRQEITYTKSLVSPARDARDDHESPVYDKDVRGVDIDTQERMFELQQQSGMTGDDKQEVKPEICGHILSEFGPNCKSSTSRASLQWTIEACNVRVDVQSLTKLTNDP